ncbi:hypothetical protein Daus18300_007558 [Diaporthe australafricana]|uniref:NmrA-like domain-containing protein n=1 Tax=Diaporthe australafricana TaxID=127596 RepID=A0ABR3WLQ7_9PEZI
MQTERNVLVIGATGKQARSTIKFLLKPDEPASQDIKFKVLALTRDTSSASARQLLERNKEHAANISLVQGDLNKPDSIQRVFEDARSSDGRGIWGVFVVLAYPGLGESADGEIRQGKLLADLALEAQVKAFVYSSSIQVGPSKDDAVDNSHRGKVEIEEYCMGLGSKGLNWIIIRPGFFMENFDGLLGALAVSAMRAGLDKDTTITLIVSRISRTDPNYVCYILVAKFPKASEDIGRVAAGVFWHHDQYLHKALAITSEVVTMEEISESYKRGTGEPIPAAPALVGRVLLKLNAAVQNVYVTRDRKVWIDERSTDSFRSGWPR